MDVSQPTEVAPTKSQSAADNLLIDSFHITLTKILHVLVLPNHLSVANFMSHQQKTVRDLLMKSFDLIIKATPTTMQKKTRNSSIGPTRLVFEAPAPTNCLQYLCDCYLRMGEHEQQFPEKSITPAVKEFFANIETELCSALALLLEGSLAEPINMSYHEKLFKLLKNHSVPTKFFNNFVNNLVSDAVRFNSVFSPLLLTIRKEYQKGSISNGLHSAALQVLADLCEIRTGDNARPFCNLMTKLSNWIVNPLTEAIGREFVQRTYLGSFLWTSMFANDHKSIALCCSVML